MVTLSPLFAVETCLRTVEIIFVPFGRKKKGLISTKEKPFLVLEETNNSKFVSLDYLLQHYEDVVDRELSIEFLNQIFFREFDLDSLESIDTEIPRLLNWKPNILYEARLDDEGNYHIYISGERDAFKIISKKNFDKFFFEKKN